MMKVNSTILKYLLDKCGELEITIDGNCMVPILNNSEKVLVQNCEKYKEGDVVLVVNINKILVHRIVKIKDGKMITKGDHSYLCDKNANSCIIGKVVKNVTQNKVLRTTIFSLLRGRKSYLESVIYRKILKSGNSYSRLLYKILYRIV